MPASVPWPPVNFNVMRQRAAPQFEGPTRVHVHLSRVIIAVQVLGLVFGATGCVLVAVLAGLSFEQGSARLAFVLAAVDVLFAAAVVFMWRAVSAELRWGRRPIVSFAADGFTFTPNLRDLVSVRYADIVGVEFEVRSSRGSQVHLVIHTADLSTQRLFINNLDMSAAQIFDEFKKRLPHLVQPFSTVQRLIPASTGRAHDAVAA